MTSGRIFPPLNISTRHWPVDESVSCNLRLLQENSASVQSLCLALFSRAMTALKVSPLGRVLAAASSQERHSEAVRSAEYDGWKGLGAVRVAGACLALIGTIAVVCEIDFGSLEGNSVWFDRFVAHGLQDGLLALFGLAAVLYLFRQRRYFWGLVRLGARWQAWPCYRCCCLPPRSFISMASLATPDTSGKNLSRRTAISCSPLRLGSIRASLATGCSISFSRASLPRTDEMSARCRWW